MAKTFADLWNELKGDIPAMSPFKAQNCVQRAWRDIRDARRWSFLFGETFLYVPGAVSAGTVTVSQFSTAVVGDAVAQAAWGPLVLHPSGIDITNRQFRLGSAPVYNITAYDPVTGTITLDRMYMETSGSGLGYMVLRCYYQPASADFLRWESLVDPVNHYRFRQRNLHRMKAELDRIDPYRNATGLPFIMASHHAATDGTPVFEMYPHPTGEVTYTAAYSRRGADLVGTDILPAAIPEELLMCRARYHAYVWCAANAGLHKELADINWQYLRRQEEEEYQRSLVKVKTNDEETFLMNWSESEQDPQLSGPLDASYIQSHDVFWV